jgi:hypothetical protein
MPIIPATQEAEMRRIMVQGQLGQIITTKKVMAEWLKW